MEQRIDGEDFELIAAERCPRCQGPVDVISPSWLTIEIDLKAMRFIWLEKEHYEDMCLDCTLASLADEQRRNWSETADILLNAREELHLRPDVTLVHHRIQNAVLNRKVQSTFQLDLFFLMFRGRPGKEWRVPANVFVADGSHEPFGMLIVRQMLSLNGVVPKVVVTWDLRNLLSKKTKFEIVDWEEANRRDLERLMQGGMYFAKQLTAGRTPGTTRFSMEQCLSMYRRQIETRGHIPPNMEVFCELADIPFSTFRGYLRNWNMKWSDFRRLAEGE